jgi:hypothetical protein
MKLPSDVQFFEDAHLLVYRPRGLVDEAVISVSSDAHLV